MEGDVDVVQRCDTLMLWEMTRVWGKNQCRRGVEGMVRLMEGGCGRGGVSEGRCAGVYGKNRRRRMGRKM